MASNYKAVRVGTYFAGQGTKVTVRHHIPKVKPGGVPLVDDSYLEISARSRSPSMQGNFGRLHIKTPFSELPDGFGRTLDFALKDLDFTKPGDVSIGVRKVLGDSIVTDIAE